MLGPADDFEAECKSGRESFYSLESGRGWSRSSYPNGTYPPKNPKLLLINPFDTGTFVAGSRMSYPAKILFDNGYRKNRISKKIRIYDTEESQTHSPSFPYLRRSVAVGANRCDLTIPEPAPISPKVKQRRGEKRSAHPYRPASFTVSFSNPNPTDNISPTPWTL